VSLLLQVWREQSGASTHLMMMFASRTATLLPASFMVLSEIIHLGRHQTLTSTMRQHDRRTSSLALCQFRFIFFRYDCDASVKIGISYSIVREIPSHLYALRIRPARRVT
jgi:uncharacterized membrane protein